MRDEIIALRAVEQQRHLGHLTLMHPVNVREDGRPREHEAVGRRIQAVQELRVAFFHREMRRRHIVSRRRLFRPTGHVLTSKPSIFPARYASSSAIGVLYSASVYGRCSIASTLSSTGLW